MNTKDDKFILGGHEFTSRFILGSGKFSLDLVKACIEKADAQIITLALRRANEGGLANILDYIPDDVTLLPNTSGARNAKEAVRIARLSRELGCGDFVKVEVVHDSKYLLPDNYETIKATEILAKEGFVVMPYMYPDLNAARALADAGAACIMPLGAPIGSNKGLCSMLAASFAGTTAFAASDKPTPVEGEIETGAVMGYSHSGMDTSYMLDAAAKPRMLSRAARSAQEELPARPGRVGHLLGLRRDGFDRFEPVR